jgi:hypothetical protein
MLFRTFNTKCDIIVKFSLKLVSFLHINNIMNSKQISVSLLFLCLVFGQQKFQLKKFIRGHFVLRGMDELHSLKNYKSIYCAESRRKRNGEQQIDLFDFTALKKISTIRLK